MIKVRFLPGCASGRRESVDKHQTADMAKIVLSALVLMLAATAIHATRGIHRHPRNPWQADNEASWTERGEELELVDASDDELDSDNELEELESYDKTQQRLRKGSRRRGLELVDASDDNFEDDDYNLFEGKEVAGIC